MGLGIIVYFVVAFVVMDGDICWCITMTKKDPMTRYKMEARLQSVHGSYVPEITQNSSNKSDAESE